MNADLWIAAITALAIIAGNWFVVRHNDNVRRRDDKSDITNQATIDATQAAILGSLAAQVDAVAKLTDDVEGRFHKHEVECAAFHSEVETILAEIKTSLGEIKRTLENQQRQLTNLALGFSPNGILEVPPTPRVRNPR